MFVRTRLPALLLAATALSAPALAQEPQVHLDEISVDAVQPTVARFTVKLPLGLEEGP